MNRQHMVAAIGLAIVIAALMCMTVSDDSDAASTYTIRYVIDEGCGTNSVNNPTSYNAGTTVTLADPEAKEGYTFVGWYVQSFFGMNKVTSISNGNYTVYAYWYYECEIEYHLNGFGTDNPDILNAESNPTTFKSNGSLTLDDPVYEGHEFVRWYYDSSSISKTTTTPVEKIELYAIWNYKLTFDLDGGTGSYPETFNALQRVNISDPVKEGYKFLGWVDEEGNPVTKLDYEDTTLIATWEKLATYTVTYIISDTETKTVEFSEGEGLDELLVLGNTDTMYFNGWCIDGDHSKRVEYISSDTTENLVLEAWWIPVSDITGHYYTMDYKRTTTDAMSWSSSSQTVNGTFTVKYYQYDTEKGFYSISVLNISGESTVDGGWDSESESSGFTWTYKGMTEYNGYLCELYEGTNGSVKGYQYIYEGWIPVHLEYQYTVRSWTGITSVTIEYDLVKTDSFDIDAGVSVVGYGDVGIRVSGSGSYSPGDTVVLEAVADLGTTFKGWYDSNGNLLSDSTTYEFYAFIDTDVYALNDVDEDFSYGYLETFGLYHMDGVTDIHWSVYNVSTKNTETYEGEVSLCYTIGGTYQIRYYGNLNGTPVYGYYTILVDGDVVRTYEWTANGVTYSIDLTIKYSDYRNYHESDVTRSYTNTDAFLEFVTATNSTILQLAKYIVDNTQGMNDHDRLYVLLLFVQTLEYQYDSESTGQEEYFKYPVETLYDMNGDCEDTSFLFCSVACAMGYESALLLFQGHMASAVMGTDGTVSGSGAFTLDGNTYYYCETTATGYDIGTAPSGYRQNESLYQAMVAVKIEHKLVHVEAVEADTEHDGNIEYYHCDGCGLNFTDSSALELVENVVIPKITAEKTVTVEEDSITLTVTDLKELKESVKTVEYRFQNGYVTLTYDVISTLLSSGKDYVLNVDVASDSDLTTEQKKAVGNGKAYVITLVSGESELHELGSNIVITIPCSNEPEKTRIYCISEDGTKTAIEDYTIENGYARFEVDHLSVFSVETVEEKSGDAGFPTWILAVIAIVAFIALIVVVVRSRTGKTQ